MSIDGKLDKAYDEGQIDTENEYKYQESRQIEELWDEGLLTPSEGYGASSDCDVEPSRLLIEDDVS